MFGLAFTPGLPLRGSTTVTNQSHLQPQRLSLLASSQNVRKRSFWRASSRPDSGQGGTSAEDEALSLELRNKVNELFGSRQNVTIEMEADSDVQFTVHGKTGVPTDYQERKAAWTVISSVAAISVVAGVAFIALFYSGAIHGSNQIERRYEMPTYGKSSFINPYELLEEDRQFQESDVLPDY